VKKNLFARIVGKIHRERYMNVWIAIIHYARSALTFVKIAENIYVMGVTTIIRITAVK